jgi:hypothetical protein
VTRPHLANEKAQAQEQRLDRVRASQYFADLRDIMATPAGRRFIYRMIFEICHVEALSFTGNSETYLREGERNAGLTIMNELIDRHADAYMTMITEMLAFRKEELMKRKQARENPAETEE